MRIEGQPESSFSLSVAYLSDDVTIGHLLPIGQLFRVWFLLVVGPTASEVVGKALVHLVDLAFATQIPPARMQPHLHQSTPDQRM